MVIEIFRNFILFIGLMELFALQLFVVGKPILPNHNTIERINKRFNEDEWNMFQKKLALTDEKVNLLKSQKDQRRIKELLHRFLKEHPNLLGSKSSTSFTATATPTPILDLPTSPYSSSSSAVSSNHKTLNKYNENVNFHRLYYNVMNQLKLSSTLLKTSLNFVLADKTQAALDRARARREIAVKMTSDLPSERINELLEIFNKENNLNKDSDSDDDNDHDHDEDTTSDIYGDYSNQSSNTDLAYEHLYEDEEDINTPVRRNHNSQFGSIQDLILEGWRNELQRELEANKLNNRHVNVKSKRLKST